MSAAAAKDQANSTTPAEKEFVISRLLKAPRELVFACFTDPRHMKQWWGPKGFTVIASTMELRPGGFYHYGMRAPDGSAMWGKFTYREIEKPSRIVLVSTFSDAAGGVTRHPLAPSWPLQMLSTFLFDTEGEGTRLTIKWLPIDPTDEERATFEAGRAGMTQGWSGTFEQLEAYLATVK
jgi:uncharacterized protein YndB with AHSA1/START domain